MGRRTTWGGTAPRLLGMEGRVVFRGSQRPGCREKQGPLFREGGGRTEICPMGGGWKARVSLEAKRRKVKERVARGQIREA